MHPLVGSLLKTHELTRELTHELTRELTREKPGLQAAAAAPQAPAPPGPQVDPLLGVGSMHTDQGESVVP